jgi:hypothetical protein
VPPSAARSLSTAVSVTSSLVCDDSTGGTSVAKRLVLPQLLMLRRVGRGGDARAGPSPSTWRCRSPSWRRARICARVSPVSCRRSQLLYGRRRTDAMQIESSRVELRCSKPLPPLRRRLNALSSERTAALLGTTLSISLSGRRKVMS